MAGRVRLSFSEETISSPSRLLGLGHTAIAITLDYPTQYTSQEGGHGGSIRAEHQ
jgi:hypothetical protein